MKTVQTFDNAFTALAKLVNEIEDDIMIDTLADKVKQAEELISFCEIKLRAIENEVSEIKK